MRLYLQNPAYIKEHFPNAARRIRDYVNRDPDLNHTIQFNEFGAPLGLGALGAFGLALRPGSVTAFGPVMAGRRAVVAAAERLAPVTVRGDKPCRQKKPALKAFHTIIDRCRLMPRPRPCFIPRIFVREAMVDNQCGFCEGGGKNY
ncbi:hypothetical protein GGD89_001021 [Roseospira visakhapatnamensis]|uniref:Uncharacterized protein n=2 Tax=Roseospira visakhapatnamensis TaxID=390880 RepID=A0A7W6RBE2_9PROT|nr:hypothetical protein [Roseospira visakhapatnamensis]